MDQALPPRPTKAQAEEMQRRQAGRNKAVLLVLIVLVVLFFLITLVKLAGA